MTDDLPIVKSIKMVRESDLTYRLRTSADPGMVHEAAERIEKLEAALRRIRDMHDGLVDDLEERDDRTYFIVIGALEGKDD